MITISITSAPERPAPAATRRRSASSTIRTPWRGGGRVVPATAARPSARSPATISEGERTSTSAPRARARGTVWSNIVTQSGRSGRTWALSRVSRSAWASSRVTTATARQSPSRSSREASPSVRSSAEDAGAPLCSKRRSSAAPRPPPSPRTRTPAGRGGGRIRRDRVGGLRGLGHAPGNLRGHGGDSRPPGRPPPPSSRRIAPMTKQASASGREDPPDVVLPAFQRGRGRRRSNGRPAGRSRRAGRAASCRAARAGTRRGRGSPASPVSEEAPIAVSAYSYSPGGQFGQFRGPAAGRRLFEAQRRRLRPPAR